MTDCPNGEMRDQLPAYVHGRLDAATRAAVEAHIAGCAECATELALLHSARRVINAGTPTVDVRRIVAALPAPPAARRVARVPGIRPARKPVWSTLRIAAALATVAIGGVSIAVVQRLTAPEPTLVPAVATAPVTTPAPVVAPVQPAPVVATPAPVDVPAAGEVSEGAPLTVGGGMSDMSDADVKALLGAMDNLDGVPDAEPQPTVPGLHGSL
jgi:anti-sigma factor RsiW